MAQKIIVLGAGLVGSAIVTDLSKSGYEVTVSDINEGALERVAERCGARTIRANFSEPVELQKLIMDKDLVVGAAPGSVGYRLMEMVIRAGKNMVDISFCPEEYLGLDELAKEHGTILVADMGVAPGMCNAILGYHDGQMQVQSYKCIVGGLPFRRTWPLEYKSSWSPIDCIEEYIRPARLMLNGKVVTRPALSDTELVEFDEVGTLEEWNSDGLRSLLSTMPHIPNMVEKTLRYPGTTNYVRALRDLGYFSYEMIEVNGHMIKPIDLTAKLLFPAWKLEKGEGEFTIMRVIIEGMERGKPGKYQYDLYDCYEPVSDTLSMARTTGYTCSGTAEMVLKGMISSPGVYAPERVGKDPECFRYLLSYLEERNVKYRIANS